MSPQASVTLETKCWERDWEVLLKTDYLETLIARNPFPFAVRALFINNVSDCDEVLRWAEVKRRRGVLTEYHVVADYAAEALAFFRIAPEALGRGYYYSIAELVGLYLARTGYLLHYSGDSLPERPVNWVPAALRLMQLDPRVRVANLTWNGQYEAARAEAFAETPDFYLGYGFSDQCYLVPVQPFRAPIYNESHPASSRYPEYGGELFEKRVDAWMRTRGWLRATYRHGSYRHPAL